jgi:hypothetical protein
MDRFIQSAISDAISVPDHIRAAANAVAYDLLHGPSYSLIPKAGIESFDCDCFATFAQDLDESEGEITETYCGPVADALRAFIDDLPTLYVDESGYASEIEPEGYYVDLDGEECDSDVDGAEYVEPGPYYLVDSSSLVESLFGQTIARHFR